MATTTDMTSGGTTGHPTRRPKAYVVEKSLDWAEAIVAKGSALIAADTFTLIDIPADTIVLGGTIEVVAVTAGGTVSACTVDVGTAAGDTIADGVDVFTAVGYGAAGTNGGAMIVGNVAADTLDVTIATITGAIATGSVRVSVVLVDVSDK